MISRHVLFSVLAVILIYILRDQLRLIINEQKSSLSSLKSRYDYASADSGAKIIEWSRHMYGAKGILRDDRDKYLLVPCETSEKWVEISLIEDILIDEVQFIQGEMYSSSFKEVQIYFSTFHPTDSWNFLTRLTLLPVNSQQKFKVRSSWARFIRLVFLSHYENEHYCALTQFSVYGSTILQNLNEDYKVHSRKVQQSLDRITSLSFDEFGLSNTSFIGMIKQLQTLETLDFILPETNINDYLYGIEDDQSSTQIVVYEGKRNHKTKNDVLRAMIKHMAKTEVKLELFDRYFLLLVDFIEKNAETINSLTNKVKKIENRIRSEKMKHNRIVSDLEDKIFFMQNKYSEANQTYNQLFVFVNEVEKSLKFLKVCNFVFIFFILIAGSVIVQLLQNSKNHQEVDIKPKLVRTKQCRSSTISSDCSSTDKKIFLAKHKKKNFK